MSPPEPPRRGNLPLAVSEPNVARGPHTPVPEAPTVPPPPAMPMAPPKHLAAPRARLGSLRDDQTLVGLAPPAERRPAPVNPPPPESMRPPMPSVEVAEARAVTLARGKWSLSLPNAVAMALIASLGGAVVTWINKPSQGDMSPIAKDLRNKVDLTEANCTKQVSALSDRFNTAETKASLQQGALESIAAARPKERIEDIEARLSRLQDAHERLKDRVNERGK